MNYLLDTNICIYIMRQQPAVVAARFESTTVGDACMSIITFAELRAGIERQGTSRARDERVLDMFLQLVPVLPFGEAAARTYGVMRAAVPEPRKNALDRLIAAHAFSLNVTLVTNNEGDFKGYPGLRVENWAVAAAVG